jgi:formylglycine-generating enzyme required for sulfatase activity
VTDVGAYGLSVGPYGTFDQGGNAYEWNEEIVAASTRNLRGGAWDFLAGSLAASAPISYGLPANADVFVGFRVARPLPEPGQLLLSVTGGLVLAVVRRRRA